MSQHILPSILVVEDSTAVRRILSNMLVKLNFSVISFGDGAVAWDYLLSNNTDDLVAIISDIMMPNMSGLELLVKTKSDDRFKHLPFVIISAVDSREYVMTATQHEAQAYLLKPISIESIRDKLIEFLPNLKNDLEKCVLDNSSK